MRKSLLIIAGLFSTGSFGAESQGIVLDQSALLGGACFPEKVAFTTTRANPTFVPVQNAAEVYLMNPDGSDPQRITENEVGDSFPVLSPDGKKIVFDSNRLRTATEVINTSDLFVMASDGTEQTYLTRGSSASWEPQYGKYITYHASASGSGVPIRMDPGAPPSDSDIFILNVDDAARGLQAPVNLTNSEMLIEDDPHWSPDGQSIVYVAHQVNDTNQQMPTTAEVFVIKADGWGVPVQLTGNSAEERAPAWSPDGSKIVFMCRYGSIDNSDFEICVINPDGSGLVQVTNNAVQELSIRWSVDGQKFFFNRPVPGLVPGPPRNQLFSINADGSGETQLTADRIEPDGKIVSVGINLFPAPGVLRVKTDCAPGR